MSRRGTLINLPSVESPQPVQEHSQSAQTLTQRAFTGAGWSAASTAARQVLSIGSIALLGRLLGPGAYGLLGMAALLTGFLAVFRDLGTTSAVIQRPELSGRLLSSLFWVNCGIGVTLFVAATSVAGLTAGFFNEPQLASLIPVLALSFVATSAGMMHYALLSRQMAFRKVAIADQVGLVAGYAVSITAALLGRGVWSLVFGSLTTSIVTSVGYWIGTGWRPSFEFDRKEVASVAHFSLNLSGFMFVNFFSRNADNVIVGKWLGNIALGYYQMSYNMMSYPLQSLTSVLGQVLIPAFSRIQTEDDRFRSAYIRSSLLLGLVTFPVFAGITAVADPLVRTVFGQKWIPSIVLIQILAPVGMIQSVLGLVGQIYTAKGRTDWMFRFGLCASVVFVISFLIGARWGTAGVAGAYAIAFFLVAMYPTAAIPFRLIGLSVRTYVSSFLPQFAITGLMAGCCLLWERALTMLGVNSPPIHLATTIAIGAAIYTSALLRLRPPVIGHLEEVLRHQNNPIGNRVLGLISRFARA